MEVKDLKLRKILATNSKETVEVELVTERGSIRSSVPIGTSVGKYEVKWLEVNKVLKIFPKIKKRLKSKEFHSQDEVDLELKKLDGTPNFSRIGGNLALGISSAFLKAFTLGNDQEVFEYLGGKKLPKPLCNVAGGWVDSEIQEFLVFPKKQRSFREEIFKIAEFYLKLGESLRKKDKSFKFSKNYESAWVSNLRTEEILDLIKKEAKKYGLLIGVDVAGNYSGRKKEGQFDFISSLIKKFSLKYVEDPFEESDFKSFASLQKKFKKVIVCGDDLIATNPRRLKLAIKKKAVSGVIVKPNQVGTISDTIKVVGEAKRHKITTIISHRSGETEDTLICHLAVGLESEFAKIGISGERIVKINELIRIEEKIAE